MSKTINFRGQPNDQSTSQTKKSNEPSSASNSDNLIFSLDQLNTKEHIVRFLKFYDGFLRSKDETAYISYLIDNSLKISIKDFIDQRKAQDKVVSFAYKATRITIEGNIYGFWACTSQSLLFCPVINSIDQKILEFNLTDVKGFLKYRYLMKHTAIELWMYNKKRSLLIAFEDNETQLKVFEYLKANCTKIQTNGNDLDVITQQWRNNEITNFEYLMYLNTMGNRSFNDISAYPVFPWVVQNYESKSLELDNPEFFRDLSKPIGAINKHRLQRLKDYYTDIQMEKYKNSQGYLYPTHYSRPGLVVYYLIRKIPEFIIKLSYGAFGPPDQILNGVGNAWKTAMSLDTNFKELIPEFFFSDGDFLVNNDKLGFDVNTEGDFIEDVILPKWANNVCDFLQKMRECLECDYVSQNLHNWIDLIFGYKQTGEAAEQANNVFYPMAYEQNIFWNNYKSANEKGAIQKQLIEFGQCPVILFKQPHPKKKEKKAQSQLINKPQEQLNVLMQKYQTLQNENFTVKNQLEVMKQQLTKQSLGNNQYNNGNQNGQYSAGFQQQSQQQYQQQFLEMQNQIKQLQAQNEHLNQLARGFQDKVDMENSASSQFLQTMNDQSVQPIQEHDFDFLNDTDNSNHI